jgi:hypothetical protein
MIPLHSLPVHMQDQWLNTNGTEGQTVDEFLQCCKKECPELNISRRTLYRWTKNYKKMGLEGLIDKRGIRFLQENSDYPGGYGLSQLSLASSV